MDLAELFPNADYRFHLGLSRGKPEEFFGHTASHEAIMAERRAWLQDTSDRYAAALPESGSLLAETVALARGWMRPEEARALDHAQQVQVWTRALGVTLEPDLLLLERDVDGIPRLVAGCVCFPSSWRLSEKIGQPLESIHGPVPGLNSSLGKQVQTFLTRLTPGTAWLRHNWGLSASPELNQHPDRDLPRLGEEVEADKVWLRVEHQALVALPETGGVLFGIRVTSHPLVEVTRETAARQGLARALRSMPDEVAIYKNVARARPALLRILEN
jgi:dimethylamine monooxygenase subunit A